MGGFTQKWEAKVELEILNPAVKSIKSDLPLEVFVSRTSPCVLGPLVEFGRGMMAAASKFEEILRQHSYFSGKPAHSLPSCNFQVLIVTIIYA